MSSLQTSDTDTAMHDGTGSFLTAAALDGTQRGGYVPVGGHFVGTAGQTY